MRQTFKKLNLSDKTKHQIYKLFLALILSLFLLVIVELLFQIPTISNAFGGDTIENQVGVGIWIALWFLMFAQVTIIPVPAIPIYIFCNGYNGIIANGPNLGDLLSFKTLFFILFVTSACLMGAICAYQMGKFGGKKAIKWIAGEEEDYNLWCSKLNCKIGKWIYAATVLFPIFPDDIICVVVGAMKIDFKFFVLTNIIGRIIGIVAMCLFMRLPIINNFLMSSLNGGFPWALLVYSILLIISIVAAIFWKKRVLSTSCIYMSNYKEKDND